MTKLRVLIIDDEIRIARLIRSLINWEKLNLECIAILDNGEMGKKYILNSCPDIIITDVRMPVVTGLDLVKFAKRNGKSSRFIIISGYAEFEYAKEALEYGVKNYLLKPINEHELDSSLKKLIEEINYSIVEQNEEHRLKELAEKGHKILKKDLLSNIIDYDKSVTHRDIQTNYNISMNEYFYRGIEIKLDYIDYKRIDKRQDLITVKKLIDILEKILEYDVDEFLICEKPYLQIFIMLNYNINKSKMVNDLLNKVISKIVDELISFNQYEVTLGVGDEKNSITLMKESIDEARIAISNRIGTGTDKIIYFSTVKENVKHYIGVDIERFNSTFYLAVEALNVDDMRDVVQSTIKKDYIPQTSSLDYIYELAAKFINTFYSLEIFSDENEKQKLYTLLYTSKNIDSIKNMLIESFSKAIILREGEIHTRSSKPIRDAKMYIESKYFEKITLKSIADEVGLNPVYFSTLFKKEEGVNFSDYLVKKRMEKAKQLLILGNDTIVAVASKVGYKDSRNFSKIFTRIVGIKPAIYRKIHS